MSITAIKRKISNKSIDERIEYIEDKIQRIRLMKPETRVNLLKVYTKDLQKSYISKAKEYEQKGDTSNAEAYYSKAGLNKGNGYDRVAEVLSVIAGLGLIFSFYATPKVISAQDIQLAPPLPNFAIYIFLAVLLASGVYLVAKSLKRKKSNIPLSF